MNDKKTILYVGNFFYPDGNAAGKRVRGNASALIEAGYRVVVLCFRNKKEEERLIVEDCDGVDVYTIPYVSGWKRTNNRIPFEAFKFITKKYPSIDFIVMYGSLGTTNLNLEIIKYGHKRNWKVLYDYCDLFTDFNKNNILRFFMKKREAYCLENKILPSCDCYFVISEYLKNNVPKPDRALIIPPLAVERASEKKRVSCGKICFSYASYLSDKNRPVSEWKDRIDLEIDIFHGLYCQGIRNFILKFVGFNENALIDMFLEEYREIYRKKVDDLKENIVFIDQCDNHTAQNEIVDSDFTVLFRDSKISTNAGFPTKVSESISLGVPVIVNLTSDIGKYVKEGINGFIISEPQNISQSMEKVRKILSMTGEELYAIRASTAKENCFYYLQYTNLMNDFLQNQR